MGQAIALIDGNNFYAACEQNIDPSIAGRPVVVLSNNDGCIVARSAEARELGIAMGQPYFKIRHELKRLGVAVRSSNYALYGDMSKRLMDLLTQHCGQIEVYSIDEAFTQIDRPCAGDLTPWARELRATVHQNIGLPISIGIGTSKVQAKLANRLAKTVANNAGIFDLYTVTDLDSCLEDINIKDVWGVGKQLTSWFRIRGINTARHLRDMPSNQLLSKCGIRGIRLQKELQGEPCLVFEKTPKKKKQTCISRSYKHPITSLEELRQRVSSQVIKASEKLRKQKQLTRKITVFANTSPFNQSFFSKSATIQLETPSNDTVILLKASLALTQEIFQPSRLFIKVGVTMQNLQNNDYLQLNILKHYNNQQMEQRERLMMTVDHLNKRYGNGTINWAISMPSQNDGVRREQLGCNTTTEIMKIPIVYS